jgi:hypothetical protein
MITRLAKTLLLCTFGLTVALFPAVSAAQTNAGVVAVEPAQALEQVESGKLVGGRIQNTLGDITGDLTFFPLAPCRLYDSRTATAVGLVGPMLPNTTRAISVNDSLAVQGGNPAGCGVPTAQPPALAITITSVNATGPGNLRTFATGTAVPVAATLVYNAGLLTSTGAITPSSATGLQVDELSIRNQGGANTDVVVDVAGYFQKATVPLGRAYAKVFTSATPTFDAARTKGFSAVTQATTGVFCLTFTDPTLSAATAPVIVTPEWDSSSGFDLLAYHSASAFGCPAGTDVGVRTYVFAAGGTPVLSDNVDFYVWVP